MECTKYGLGNVYLWIKNREVCIDEEDASPKVNRINLGSECSYALKGRSTLKILEDLPWANKGLELLKAQSENN